MPESQFDEITIKPLSFSEVEQLQKEYHSSLHQQPFIPLTDTTYPSILKTLKRDAFRIGPYTRITIFEAANRIASDLTLLEGVTQLFKTETISPAAKVKLRLGTMQEIDKGDFSVFENGGETQGEAFDVAPSFFKSKLYTTLKKWDGSKAFKYVVFNLDCLNDPTCKTYYENQKTKLNGEIVFLGVKSWHT